jgi:hypothetical protein
MTKDRQRFSRSSSKPKFEPLANIKTAQILAAVQAQSPVGGPRRQRTRRRITPAMRRAEARKLSELSTTGWLLPLPAEIAKQHCNEAQLRCSGLP